MPIKLVDPRAELSAQRRNAASRLPGLRGRTIGLLDISKPGGSIFLDRLEQLLIEQHGVASVVRAAKPTFTKPAPDEVIKHLSARCDAVVEALAD